MARSILKDGRVIENTQIVDFSPTITQCADGLTPDEYKSLGIVPVIEQERPDERYGSVREDPKNPGAWLFTKFSDEELKARLIDFAAQKHFNKTMKDTKASVDPTVVDDIRTGKLTTYEAVAAEFT